MGGVKREEGWRKRMKERGKMEERGKVEGGWEGERTNRKKMVSIVKKE